MLRHLFILTFLTLPFNVFSQVSEINYKDQLKLSAFRPFNILNPGIEVSYENFFSSNLSSQLSVGIATNVVGKPYKKLKGYNVAFEEKYFIRKQTKSRKYLSLEFNYTDINYQERTSGMDTVNNITIIDTFTIGRKTQALAIKYGIQFYKKHFVVDFSIGAGLKYRSVKHYDRTFEYKGPREPFDLMRAANVEKTGFAFTLPFNIRLGYSF